MTDYTVADTIYMLFTTRAFATGIPGTLGGSPVVSAYENDSTTQITAGITLGADHDSVTGLNLLTIVATGANGYESGKDYSLVITTGTVDSVSVVGEVVGHFSLGRSAAAVDLANATDGLGAIKTDTAAILVDTGTTLDSAIATIDSNVDAILVDTGTTLDAAIAVIDTNVDQIETAVITNAAGVDISADIAAVKAETASILTDTGTTLDGAIATIDSNVDAILVDTSTTLQAELDGIQADTEDIQGRLPAALVGGRIDANIGAISSDSVAADNLELDYDGTGYAKANSTIGTCTTNTDMVAAAPTAASTADAVWDEATSGHVGAGSFGLQQADILTDTAAILVDTGTTLDAAIATIDTNVDQIETAVITNAAGVDIAADIAAVKAETASILTDTGTTLDAAISVIDANVDQIETAVITNAAGVDIAADIIAIKAETATILTDTGTTLDTKLNDIQGATFSSATDSLEAIRDRGDAAWITGGGGGADKLVLQDTTIATLSSQTSFTLTAGSADDDAYNNCTIVIEDVSTATQKAVGLISDYTGSTKTVTLKYDPAIFTMATTDKVYILAENSLKSTDQNRQLDVTATGAAGIDWGNVENPTTALDLSGTDIQLVDTCTTNTDVAAVKSDTAAILTDTGTTLDTKLNDIQGATFNNATDSLEAIRDRGDSAWTTGAGGSDRLLMVDTTIATLSSQTSFTLNGGSTDDDAYNNCTIVIEDAATAAQKAVGLVSDYVGSTKTVTLKYDPGIFTMAATDKVYILAENSLKSSSQNVQLALKSTGVLDDSRITLIWIESL